MEPDNNYDNLAPSSGSEGSQELSVCESLEDSYNENDVSDAEYQLNPKSDTKSHLEPQIWQRSLPNLSRSDEDISYQEEDEIYISESRESLTECLQIGTSATSHPADRTSHSPSSSSSPGCAALTLALTLTTDEPVKASRAQGPQPANRRTESSEGGSSEAPPASVYFGISDEFSEQAERRNSASDADLCRLNQHRAQHTRLRRSESQSERHVKETKSKCKHIARLLTDAPNPLNKGALLFKRRRQRVKKFTLVSYGTGDSNLDIEDQIQEEAEEVRSAECNFAATSDSDLEEENFVYPRQWKSFEEMEELPDAKGKGVMMFAQRRKRMDQILSEHEELMSKGLLVEPLLEHSENQNTYNTKEMYNVSNQPIQSYMDANLKQNQESVHKMSHISNVPKPLVPNRTAKPFPGIQENAYVPVQSPVLKRHDPRFKVPVPINTSPYVWSPTGDIIASRDERISVPAIKTGILPEPKRRGINKPSSTLVPQSDVYLQNKGERRSYIEPEEDFFSLGAEASNFMQPRAVKLKHPPPVAPKPAFNPTCPPWVRRSPNDEPYIPQRSPVSQPCRSPEGPHIQQHLRHDSTQQQEMANRRTPDQTLATRQTPASAWASSNTSSQLHVPPTTTNRSQQLPRSPVSIRAHSSSHSPHHPPSASRNKTESAPNSVASCPPPAGKSYIHTSKATTISPKGRLSDRDISRAGDGPTMMGKGAELFAKRQSRMEKFVVDAERVQDHKARSPSPSSSLPHSWRYSPNVRAPPPLSYNPLLAPFYPPSAAKQPPSTSPQIKAKTKAKSKPPPKHLNTLDIMKHQPYQLDSSLFKYDATIETKSPSPKPTPESRSEGTHSLKQRSASYQSPYQGSDHAVQRKSKALKSSGLVSSENSASHQSMRSAEPISIDKHLDEIHTYASASPHIINKRMQSSQPASTRIQPSPAGDSVALAFSPASLIARGTRQMAPRPKFSAKKPMIEGKQWKSVPMIR